MSTVLLTRGPAALSFGEGDSPPPTDETGPTLDDVISRAWEVLGADVPAACPACGGELVPRESAGAGIVGGRCEACGTTLW